MVQPRWTGKRRVMTAKMFAATLNINANKQNQLKITKETLISELCCSCVRLLVHRFNFSMLLEKNIRVIYIVDENNLPNSVCLERKSFGF